MQKNTDNNFRNNLIKAIDQADLIRETKHLRK